MSVVVFFLYFAKIAAGKSGNGYIFSTVITLNILFFSMLLIYVVMKQRELYYNLRRALFFHDLVNRSRVIKYFVLIDLWIL